MSESPPDETKYVWIFNGKGGHFPGGVFSRRELAHAWIAYHKLNGVLTCYPLGEGCMDWAIRTGLFKIAKPESSNLARSKDPDFVGSFSSALQDHVHYENGSCE